MVEPYAYIQEYEFNTILAGMIKALSKDYGIICSVFLRDEAGIRGAYKKAKSIDADCCIELHFNWFTDPSVSGAEVLYGDTRYSESLATHVHLRICDLFFRSGKQNRGIKLVDPGQRGYSNVNNGTGIPSILIEPFFGSSRYDCDLVLRNLDTLAQSILEGIRRWGQGGASH